MKKSKSKKQSRREMSITTAQLDTRVGTRALAEDTLSSITGGGNAVYPESCGKHGNI